MRTFCIRANKSFPKQFDIFVCEPHLFSLKLTETFQGKQVWLKTRLLIAKILSHQGFFQAFFCCSYSVVKTQSSIEFQNLIFHPFHFNDSHFIAIIKVLFLINYVLQKHFKKGYTLSGIRWGHHVMGFDSPIHNPFVQLAFEGCQRLCQSETTKKELITTEMILS